MAVDSGMDVERMRSIAQQLMAQGDRVASVASSGRGQLTTLGQAWQGPDVDSFTSRWDGAEKAAHHASDALRTYGRQMLAQAADQERTSGSGGGPGGGPGGPGGRGSTGGPGGPGGPVSPLEQLKDLLSGDVKSALNALKKGFQSAGALLGLARYLKGGGSWLQQFSFLSKYLGKDEAIRALGRIGPMTLKEAKAAGLAGWISRLGRFGPMIRTAGGLLGKVAGPVGAIFGGLDIYNGIKDGDWLTVAKGGAGLVSGVAVTALAFGGAALAGTAAAPFVLGAAVVGGAIWAGIEIWQNREAIWDGMKSAGGWVADRAGEAWDGAKDLGGKAKDAAGSVLGGIKDGLGSVFG